MHLKHPPVTLSVEVVTKTCGWCVVDSWGPTEAAAGWFDGDGEEAATGHQGPETHGGHPRQGRHEGPDPTEDGQEDAAGG